MTWKKQEESLFMESENQQNKDLIVKMAFSLILFMVTYRLVLTYFETGISDFPYHSQIAEGFHFSNLKAEIESGNTYFMWSALVALLHRRGNVTLYGACAVITALANVATLHVVMEYIKRKVPKADNTFRIYFGAGLLFVGPLFFPWINADYYLGTWSPNTWHNPTNIMVRPFAMLSVILILDILEAEETKRKEHIFLAVILALSVIAKPSFLQGIAPALVLYVLSEVFFMRRLFWRKYLLLAATFIPAGCIMLFQLWLTFYSGNTLSEGVGIGYLKTLGRYTNNEWVSLFACTAFPIFVIIAAVIIQKKKVLKDRRIILTICYLISSWCEMAFLYEKGERERHANFTWGYMIAVFVAFVLTVIEFLDITGSDIKYKEAVKKTGVVLFSCHLLLGIWYICRMLGHGSLY